MFLGRDGSGRTTGSLETDGSLEGIVDPPLETGEGTNHKNSGKETSPETRETNLGVDVTNTLTLVFRSVHLGDHSISGVRDDGAEDTSQVTGHESNGQLLGLGVLVLGLSEDVSVEEFDDLFEGDELNDGVGDLSGPKRRQDVV